MSVRAVAVTSKSQLARSKLLPCNVQLHLLELIALCLRPCAVSAQMLLTVTSAGLKGLLLRVVHQTLSQILS